MTAAASGGSTSRAPAPSSLSRCRSSATPTAGAAKLSSTSTATARWIGSGALAEPDSPDNHDFVSLKDFTVARVGDVYAVYATAFDASASWTGVFMSFSDFSQLGSAEQTWFGNRATVAPQLMYFAPKDTWVLTYQWGFQYATSDDPTDPTSWSQGHSLLSGNPTAGHGGPT